MNHNVPVDHIVGESAWTHKVRKRILQVAGYRYSVLITGPSGTGKELVARAVHHHSPRGGRPFVPVNCAALPGGLFSSQLFGHLKGAFTGASHTTLGCFRAAEGGTIFLDEIGELDFDLQAKLLRVLQERKVVPVGSHECIPVDVRVVAATNRNLEEEVRAGRFRLDLFYRLNVVSIETASLQARRDDIPLLARHFLAKAALENGSPVKRLSPSALTLLENYEWPGNIRELQNHLERAVVFTESNVIGPECFGSLVGPAGIQRTGVRASHEAKLANFDEDSEDYRFQPILRGVQSLVAPSHDGPLNHGAEQAGLNPRELSGDWPTLEQIERQHILRTLQQTFFNQSAAARLLGVDRKLLARKIRKYELRSMPIDQHSQTTE